MMAVRFIQQAFKEEDNQVKLEKAIETAKKNLDSRGIKIGGRELSEFIEAAYNRSKTEIQKQQGIPEPVEVKVAEGDENTRAEIEQTEKMIEQQADFDNVKAIADGVMKDSDKFQHIIKKESDILKK